MARSSSDAHPDQINMVGEGTTFEGTLRADSNVRVSGHIKGKIEVNGRVIVTQEGVVEGELHSTDADVAGSVQGEIYIDERLTLKSTARIDGNITTGRIKVDEGALFSGQCEIGEKVAQKVQEKLSERTSSSDGFSSATGSSSNAGLTPEAEKASKEKTQKTISTSANESSGKKASTGK